jgi:hypothetical protein
MAKLPKVDKTSHESLFFGLVKKTYLSRPVYNLAHEISDYLTEDRDYIVKEFPFMGSDDEIYINFGCLHFVLLLERLVSSLSKSELKT